MRGSVTLSIVLVLGSLQVGKALAASPRGTPEISTAVIVNLVGGDVGSGCLVTAGVHASERRVLRLRVGNRVPSPSEGWETVGRAAHCRPAREGAEDDLEVPYLLAEISLHARTLREMEDERILSVAIEAKLKKSLHHRDEVVGEFEESTLQRQLFFAEAQRTYVPLFIAAETERDMLGVKEVFLRVAVNMIGEGFRQPYGTLLVSSTVDDGVVFLDGGPVGRVDEDHELTVGNVPVGLRQVLVKGPEGAELRQVVRVAPGGTHPVNLVSPEPGLKESSLRLEPLGKNEQGYEEYRRARDGAIVVKIPAGEFLMGNRETERRPLEHMVYVSDFLMDKTAVTWGQYKRFAAATGVPLPPRKPYWGILEDHPVVYVTWEESKAYCEWVGGRLPTEAEREKGARGTDGRKYPWGDEEPDPDRSVYHRSWGYEATAAVGTHPKGASPYGLHDMGGNVWEWCSDWYSEDYYSISPYRNPPGPSSGRVRVLRGGSWDSRPAVTSASCRNWGHRGYREGDFGFRCVMNSPH